MSETSPSRNSGSPSAQAAGGRGDLWQVFERFAQIDLHPDKVSNSEMGYLFEDMIRKFKETANETSGDHYTPRDAIRLLVDLLFAEGRRH